MAVLHQPREQVGKVAVAQPGVALEPHRPQGWQLTQRPYLERRKCITLQFQFPQRGEPSESILAHHTQVWVVAQPQFNQAARLPKSPSWDFSQVVAAQVQEDQPGGGAESPRFDAGEGVVPEVQVDQVTVQNQEVRGDARNPVVRQQQPAHIQGDFIGETGQPTATAVHSVRVRAQAGYWAVLPPGP